MRKSISRIICRILVMVMIAESLVIGTYAAEPGPATQPDTLDCVGAEDYEIIPDAENAGIKVLDENGNELDVSDEKCRKAMDTYSAIVDQFSGKTIDMSGYDCTDALIEVLKGQKEEAISGEEEDEDLSEETAVETASGDLDGSDKDTKETNGSNETQESLDADSNSADVKRGEAEDEKDEVTLKAPVIDKDDVTWDCVWFGAHNESDDKDKVEALKWRVLETDGETALLMADKPFATRPFHSKAVTTTAPLKGYKDSTLRTYAENGFFNDAFNTMEQLAIAPKDGEAKITIPTWDMLCRKEYGFADDNARASSNMGYWLDAPIDDKYVFVDDKGQKAEEKIIKISRFASAGNKFRGFRPVIRINLDKDEEWSYAGTFSLKGGAKEVDSGFVTEIELDPGEDNTVNDKDSEKIKVVKGKPVREFPDAEKRQHDFLGWYADDNGGAKYTSDSVIPDDVETLYAHYASKYSNTYKFNERVTLKMADSPKNGSIPFLSNGFDFDFAGISTSLVYDRVAGTYEVGIGFDMARAKDLQEEGSLKNFLKAEGKDLSETCESVCKALSDARDLGNISKPIKVTEGNWEPSLTVMGYAEGTLGDDGLSAPEAGRLFIGFEIYTDNEWQTAICWIPIAIRLKFGAEGSLTLGIEETDAFAKTLVGDAEIVLPGIELRVGVGLARVCSIGVYGVAQNRIDIEFGRDGRSGKTAGWWYLKGEAGGYVHVLFIDHKKKFIDGTIQIYDWGRHTTNPLGSYDDIYDYEMVEEYEVKRTHEDPVADWLGGSPEVCEQKGEGEEVLGYEYNSGNGSLGDGRAPILRDMYDMPEPSVAQTDDNTAVLAFMAENNGKDVLTGDDVRAYYSVWDNVNNKWSEPAFIDEASGTAEFYPVLTTDGDDIWAIWMDSESGISEEDAAVLESIKGDTLTKEQIAVLDRCAGKFEIKAARFDGTQNKFTDFETLTNENKMCSRPAVAAEDGKVYAAWLTDNDVDFGGVSEQSKDQGTESIMTAVFDGTKWSDPVTVEWGQATYTDMNGGMVGDKPVVVDVKDKDRALTDSEDELLYARPLSGGKEIQLSEHEAHSPDFGVIDKKDALIWYEDGILRYTTDLNTKKDIAFEDTSALSPGFTVLDDYSQAEEGGTIILCASKDPEYDPEDENSEVSPYRGIYAYCLEDDEAGEVNAGWPIYIENTGVYGDVGTMTGLWKLDDEGDVTDLLLIYPETRTDFKAKDTETFSMNTTMFMTSFLNDAELEIDEEEDELFVDPEDIKPGESVSLDFAVKNNSFLDVEDLWVTVKLGDKVIRKGKINTADPIEAGDETMVTVEVDVPDDIKKGDHLTVRIDSDEQMDSDEDREIDFNVGNVNLTLDQEVSGDGNGISVRYSVENSSVIDTTGTFRLYTKDQNDNKKILFEEKDVDFPSKKTVTAEFDEHELDEMAGVGDVIYAEVEDVDGNKYERALGDSGDFFKVTGGKADEVVLSKKELILPKGGSETLTATIVPAALSETGVYWCSTDESVAKVDSNGRVTAIGAGTAEVIATANDGSGARSAASVTVNYGDLAAEGDTDALIPVKDSRGKVKGFALTLSENRTSAVVTVAKGNKFTIENAKKGTFSYKVTTDKKLVGVSKKGVVKAKKPTDGVVISYIDERTGRTVEVTVRVREMKFAGSKNLKTTVSPNEAFDLVPEILMNSEFRPKNEKYKKTVPDLVYAKDKTGKWHVTGKPVKSGSVSIPVYVYGKKFNMRIKAK